MVPTTPNDIPTMQGNSRGFTRPHCLGSTPHTSQHKPTEGPIAPSPGESAPARKQLKGEETAEQILSNDEDGLGLDQDLRLADSAGPALWMSDSGDI